MVSRAILAVAGCIALLVAQVVAGAEPDNPMARSLPLQPAFGTTNDVYVEVGERGGICIASRENCGRIRKESHIAYDMRFKGLRIAQLTPTDKVIVYESLRDPHSLQIDLWTYAHYNDSFESFSRSISEVGKYRIVDSGPLAGHVLFAEFVPDANENRYDGHHFRIDVERWMGPHKGWLLVLSYVTPDRFKGETEDSADLIEEDIFTHEMPRIQVLLQNVYPQMKPNVSRPY